MMLKTFLWIRDDYRRWLLDAPHEYINLSALADLAAYYPGNEEAIRTTYVRWVNRYYTFYGDHGRELAKDIPAKVRGR